MNSKDTTFVLALQSKDAQIEALDKKVRSYAGQCREAAACCDSLSQEVSRLDHEIAAAIFEIKYRLRRMREDFGTV